MAPTIPETDVLRARDPALDNNTDEWPEFELTSAHVRLPDDPGEAISLLEAAQHHPVTVVGQLEPLDSKLSHLYIASTNRKRVTIVVEDVRFFSYGQYPDGNIAIWAPGKAGWYALKPGRGYKQIYARMIEAVETFYFIVDAYREPRKRKRGKNAQTVPSQDIDELFARYAAGAMQADATPEEAREHIYEHKDALISFMVAGKEDINWAKNPLYAHLCQAFPEAHASITRKIKGSKAQPTLPSTAQSVSPSTEVASENTSRNTRSNRSTGSRAQTASLNRDDSSAVDTSQTDQSRRRGRPRRALRLQSVDSTTSGAGDGPSTPVQDSDSDAGLPQRQGKSILRPRASKTGKAGTRVSGKAPPRFLSGSDDDRMLSPVPGERESGESTQTSATIEGDEAQPGDSDLGAEYPQQPANDQVQEDTWVCALDGCRYKIYDASRAESQKLIREHYELHAFDDDDRVQLIKRLQEPSLPAGHLMERVKMQAKMDGYPGSKYAGTRYPDTAPARSGVNQKY